MGSRRQSRGYHRRQEEARERRRQRRIMLGIGGVLGIVAVVLLVGLLLTVVLPPRATVLVVGERSYSADDVAERTIAAIRLGAGANTIAELVDLVVETLIREELLRQAGEPIVGMPDDDTIQAEVRSRLDVDESVEDEEFAARYRQFLQDIEVSRAEFEWIVRASVTAERLREHFGEEIPEAGPQVRYYVAQARDPAVLEQLRERVLAGESFDEVVADLELAEDVAELDRGWRPEELLTDEQRDGMDGLEAGGISEVRMPPGSLDVVVYYVAEREAEREYDDGTREQMQARRLDQFLEAQREAVGVSVELSETEREWVVRRIRNAFS